MAIKAAVEDIDDAACTFEDNVKNFAFKRRLEAADYCDIWVVAYFVRPVDCWYHGGRNNLARGEKSYFVQDQ